MWCGMMRSSLTYISVLTDVALRSTGLSAHSSWAQRSQALHQRSSQCSSVSLPGHIWLHWLQSVVCVHS